MTAEAPEQPRLNPFAFISDTSLRFILLLIIVVCATMQLWYGIAVVSFGIAGPTKACLAGSPIWRGVFPEDAAFASLATCYHALALKTVPGMVTGLVLLALVSAAIYAAYPYWTIRRLGLQRLVPASSPQLQNALEGLCRTAGLRQMPEFWWNPLDGRPKQAIAFGRRKQPNIGFSGALALTCFNDPAEFQAILLHELAHIRNGDIAITYLSRSLGWAFLVSAFLPYAIVEATDAGGIIDVAFLVVDMGIVLVCVVLSHNSVLRARELYADARSLAWHQQRAPLEKALRSLVPAPWWRSLVSPHPDPIRRQQLIKDTDQMFRFGTWDAFGVGIGAGFAAFILFGFIGSAVFMLMSKDGVAGSSLVGFGAPVFSALLIVPVAAAAIAVGAWRSAFLRLMRGSKGTSRLRIAFGCACGLAVYGLILPTTIVLGSSMGFGSAADIFPRIESDPGWAFMQGVLLCTALLLTLIVALVLLLALVEGIALAWLAVSLPGRKPGATFTIGLGLCSVAAAIWSVIVPLGIVAVIGVMHDRHMSGPVAAFWSLTLLASTPPIAFVTWPSIVAIWALPLSASLFTHKSRNVETWAFESGETAPLPPVPLYPKHAIAAGLVCGLFATTTMVWLRIPLVTDAMAGSGLPMTQRAADLTSHVLSGATAVGVTALIVAGLTPKLPVVHASCAGFFASIIVAIGTTLHMRLTGWTIPISDLFAFVFSPTIIAGSMAALAGAMIGRCVAAGASFGWRRLRVLLPMNR